METEVGYCFICLYRDLDSPRCFFFRKYLSCFEFVLKKSFFKDMTIQVVIRSIIYEMEFTIFNEQILKINFYLCFNLILFIMFRY